MARVAGFVLVSLVEAGLYKLHQGTHCYVDHGGTPLDAEDTVIRRVTLDACEAACDETKDCVAMTLRSHPLWRSFDCYLHSAVDLSQCKTGFFNVFWTIAEKMQEPPLTGHIVYHLFEPKYTGLANKDGGDFKGDANFIFTTFTGFIKGNPEASMDHNNIEMSEVNVTGWGKYEECNAPGAEGHFTCPETQGDYCCTNRGQNGKNIPAKHNRTQLPGVEFPPGSDNGFWFSFPKESQNVTWTERLLRRITGKCMGNAWRKDSGGCSLCPGDALDSCVAQCIQAALTPGGNTTRLQATWDRVFADPQECPDQPLPSDATIVV